MIRAMVTAADAFLESLDRAQRRAATAAFDVPDHRHWTYLPGDRPGLVLADMTAEQRDLALRLLDTGCSAPGGQTARGVIELDMIRRQLESPPDNPPVPTDHRYWVRILGDPNGDAPWAWRVNGHHLAIHITVVGGAVAVTPQFFGAEPATVPHGPHEGLRVLPAEEELARTLLARLGPAERATAVTSPIAPHDILTRYDPVANPDVIPAGLAYGDMADAPREVLRELIGLYFARAPQAVGELAWHDVVDTSLDEVSFTWAGSDQRGHGHYYAVRGPTFLLEYDNTQDDANHIHSVWRDLRNDWGEDLLAYHYTTHHG